MSPLSTTAQYLAPPLLTPPQFPVALNYRVTLAVPVSCLIFKLLHTARNSPPTTPEGTVPLRGKLVPICPMTPHVSLLVEYPTSLCCTRARPHPSLCICLAFNTLKVRPINGPCCLTSDNVNMLAEKGPALDVPSLVHWLNNLPNGTPVPVPSLNPASWTLRCLAVATPPLPCLHLATRPWSLVQTLVQPWKPSSLNPTWPWLTATALAPTHPPPAQTRPCKLLLVAVHYPMKCLVPLNLPLAVVPNRGQATFMVHCIAEKTRATLPQCALCTCFVTRCTAAEMLSRRRCVALLSMMHTPFRPLQTLYFLKVAEAQKPTPCIVPLGTLTAQALFNPLWPTRLDALSAE